MTKKINLNFMLVIAVSVILTVLLTTAVSYRSFQREVFSNLSSFAEMMDDLKIVQQMRDEGFAGRQEELRVTWIAEDGSVLYDSYIGGSILDNHSRRPEVIQAREEGKGYCVRRSQTMEQNIFFYARKTRDGSVIRIAKEAGSIWNIFRNTIPVTLLTAVLTFLVSIGIARHLTRAFVRPIEQMASDLNRPETVSAYKELTPFIDRIRSQHEEALQNAKLRQEFTANVSHELKTPLTSISGYSELIASGMASEEEGRHFAEEISRNAGRLLALINDILQLSELDASLDDKISFASVDLYELAEGCVDMMLPAAEKMGVSLSLEGGAFRIHANRELMEELIYNLCDNAVRYNKRGGHVWIRVVDGLSVRDDGIGIPEEYQCRVFERFFRVDKSRSKKTGGTGLGLAIVKHIVQVHHASVTLESKPGQGTEIRVEFP